MLYISDTKRVNIEEQQNVANEKYPNISILQEKFHGGEKELNVATAEEKANSGEAQYSTPSYIFLNNQSYGWIESPNYPSYSTYHFHTKAGMAIFIQAQPPPYVS